MADVIKDNLISSLPYRYAAATDKGKVRPQNEDAFHIEPEAALFLIADGMGGHQGGQIASKIVAEDLPVFIENKLNRLKVGSPAAIKKLLQKTIAKQNRQLHLEGNSESGYRDMGATLVLAMLRKGRCFIANLGDSRAYRLRNNRLTQISKDHSVVSELIDAGHIEPDQAQNHPASHLITRYVGMKEKPKPFVRSFTLKKADRILLCTDGLTDMLDDKKITRILKTNPDPQIAVDALISSANNAGGHDNITAVIIDWL